MLRVNIVLITLAMLAASPLWAQQVSVEQTSFCVAVPIFHCVQYVDGETSIGHFGYDLQCPDDAASAEEIFIDIGDDNLFSPGREDRGQPKVFLSGEHVDEFEVDFSADEVKSGADIHWSVLGQTATVDFSKTKDGFMDCSKM